MHTKEQYLACRNQHGPAHLKYIIVAESPPISGEYFYKPKHSSGNDEVLFYTLMKYIGAHYSTKHEGLLQFQEAGWFLVDATYTSVNKIDDDKERDRVILQKLPELVADLRSLPTAPIILIKANVCKVLESRLLKQGFPVINRGKRPRFPWYHGDKALLGTLDEILRAA